MWMCRSCQIHDIPKAFRRMVLVRLSEYHCWHVVLETGWLGSKTRCGRWYELEREEP